MNVAVINVVSTSALEASGAMAVAMTGVLWETAWNEMAAAGGKHYSDRRR